MADKYQRNTDLVNETNEFSLHHYPEAVDRVEANLDFTLGLPLRVDFDNKSETRQ